MLRAARHRTARACVAGLSFFVPSIAWAGGPLGDKGPIQTSQYTLDLFQGPVLASTRVTGMGGAYSALAEGAEGIPFNAGAASQRAPQSTSRTDYDLTAGITFPGSVNRTDFDNNGHVGFGYDSFVFLTVGALVQRDHLGIGGVASLQSYTLSRSREGAPAFNNLTVRVAKFDIVGSYGFARDQLHLGAGIRGAVFTATESSEKLLLGTYGFGAQVGGLWRPNTLPLRVGFTFRTPVIASINAGSVDTNETTGDRVVRGFYLPTGVDLPWEAEWGVAFQIGRRPLNLPWHNEEYLHGPEVEEERRVDPVTHALEPRVDAARRILRRRYRELPREKLLVSFSMLATGDTGHDSVGVESMLTQVIDRSGEKTSLSIRLGTEAEIIPNWLQVRAGSYVEPTRFREVAPSAGAEAPRPRVHGTTGFEVRLFESSVWGIFPEDNRFRVGGAIDFAREYFGWSLGIGSWY